jgi:hypothetical protein
MAAGIPHNTVVEWLESQKGQPLLSIDGYLFTNGDNDNGKTPGVLVRCSIMNAKLCFGILVCTLFHGDRSCHHCISYFALVLAVTDN